MSKKFISKGGVKKWAIEKEGAEFVTSEFREAVLDFNLSLWAAFFPGPVSGYPSPRLLAVGPRSAYKIGKVP